jgi:type VI protein secretion system component VasF
MLELVKWIMDAENQAAVDQQIEALGQRVQANAAEIESLGRAVNGNADTLEAMIRHMGIMVGVSAVLVVMVVALLIVNWQMSRRLNRLEKHLEAGVNRRSEEVIRVS